MIRRGDDGRRGTTAGRGAGQPPKPVREQAAPAGSAPGAPVAGARAQPAAPAERTLRVDGIEWVASVAGESAAGTGTRGHAYLVAIRFSPVDSTEMAREALLPRGRFEMLYDDELRDVLAAARPLEEPEPDSAAS